MYETWFQVENFVLSGRLKLDPIITHQLPLEDFERGFRLMQSGDAIKVVLKMPQN
jgi:threonine 3-dehydrogenase